MPSSLVRFLLTLTSLAPVGLVYAALFAFDENPLFTWSSTRIKLLVCLTVTVTLVIVCLLVLWFYSSKVKQRSLQICSLRPADGPAIGFIVTYLLPVAFETAFKVNWGVLVVVAVLLAWLVYVSDTYLVNPLLRLFGYRFYEVTTKDQITYILVSRLKIVNTDEPIDVRVGSNFMFLRVKG